MAHQHESRWCAARKISKPISGFWLRIRRLSREIRQIRASRKWPRRHKRTFVDQCGVAPMIWPRDAATTMGSMKPVPISTLKNDLSRFSREAKDQEIFITRPAKPPGAL